MRLGVGIGGSLGSGDFQKLLRADREQGGVVVKASGAKLK